MEAFLENKNINRVLKKVIFDYLFQHLDGALIAVCFIPWILTACGMPQTSSPAPVSTPDPTQTLRWVCGSNVNDQGNYLPGRIVRFQTPIDINPNGNEDVLAAIANYERITGGAVDFNIVTTDPLVGISVIKGDAVDGSGQPGCGNVTDERNANSGHGFRVDSYGIFNTLVYVHLGSGGCDHNQIGYTTYSVAEHEIAHALGIGEHFTDFTGMEGLSPNLSAVVTKLYSTSPGTDMSAICSGIK